MILLILVELPNLLIDITSEPTMPRWEIENLNHTEDLLPEASFSFG